MVKNKIHKSSFEQWVIYPNHHNPADVIPFNQTYQEFFVEVLQVPYEEWINPGGSLIVSPSGEIISGPLSKEKGYLIADIDVELAASSKRALDVAGHYARPDIFTLQVDKSRQSSTYFKNNS